jgi:hypothetical protein
MLGNVLDIECEQQSHRPTSIRRIHDPGWPTKQMERRGQGMKAFF